MLPKDLLKHLERADDPEGKVESLVKKQWQEPQRRQTQWIDDGMMMSAALQQNWSSMSVNETLTI